MTGAAVGALVERGLGVPALWDELMWLLPLGGIMLQIVHCDCYNVFVGFESYTVYCRILIETGRVRIFDGSLDPECFSETILQISKLFGVLLVEFSHEVVFHEIQILIDLLLESLPHFRFLFEIAEHVARSDPDSLGASLEHHNHFINDLFIIVFEHLTLQ